MTRLTILIATIGPRKDSFLELMNILMPQTERWPIEVIAYWNNGERLIGDIRQSLLQEATGEYVCFIDDDDRVPEWYCDEIFYALGEDYVGFKVDLFEKDQHQLPVYHSIRYGVWYQDDKGFYRGITHLNPIKRELAIQGKFGGQGIGEDESWARMMMPLVRTEKFIDKVMYYYHHDADTTVFGGKPYPSISYQRPEFEHPQFRWHSRSKRSGKWRKQ